eukprot:scaffold40262_cov30-Tisochrysis_lutea.AAC.1
MRAARGARPLIVRADVLTADCSTPVCPLAGAEDGCACPCPPSRQGVSAMEGDTRPPLAPTYKSRLRGKMAGPAIRRISRKKRIGPRWARF